MTIEPLLKFHSETAIAEELAVVAMTVDLRYQKK